MLILSKFLAQVIPGVEISFPLSLFSHFCHFFFNSSFWFCRSFCAFIFGILETLIGTDLWNLRKIQKYGGYLSIGGIGVFDGIFLIGIAQFYWLDLIHLIFRSVNFG